MKTKLFTKFVIGGVFLFQTAIVSASVVGFNINQTFTQGNGSSDISATNISLGGAGSFFLDPGFSGDYFDFRFNIGTFSTIATEIDDYYFLNSYAAGDTVGSSNFGNHLSPHGGGDWDTILVDNATAGVWGASHDGYLGFLSDSGLYGWIGYSFLRTDSSTLTLLSGAYEDVANADIVIPGASAVPVPAALFLFAPALLGFLGLRRKVAAVA